jgi:competence protein ComEC
MQKKNTDRPDRAKRKDKKKGQNLQRISKRAKIALPCIGVAAVVTLAVVNYFFPFFNRVSAYIIPQYEAGDLRIHFVDVGQGDCAMIELPDGKFMIIDGGEKSQEGTVVRYANALGMEKIDYLVISHTDSDHAGGLRAITKEMPIGEAYLPFASLADSASKIYATVYQNILENASLVRYTERYDEIDGGEAGYYMTFLSPHDERAYNGSSSEVNDLSAVLWLDYYGTDALFTGDISSSVEEELVSEWLLDGNIFNGTKPVLLDSTEILKVAHHGSQYSSSADWLELLNFQTAVISCGAGNQYGHPRQETLDRLCAASPSANIYRTDELGSIIVTMHADGTYEVDWSETLISSACAPEEVVELLYISERDRT